MSRIRTRRANHSKIEINGELLTPKEATKKYATVSYKTVSRRLSHGWDPVQAILLPRHSERTLDLPIVTTPIIRPNDQIGKIVQGFQILKRIPYVKGQHKDPYWEVQCLCCGERFFKNSNMLSKLSTPYCLDCTVRNRKPEVDFNKKSCSTYCGMMDRCFNPNNVAYKNYGARGISVCDEWTVPKEGLAAYRSWILSQEGGLHKFMNLHYHIDRRDNDKGYSPENCQLIPLKENNRNKRNNVWVEMSPNEILCFTDAVNKYAKASRSTVTGRLLKDFTLLEAILLPPLWCTLETVRKLNITHPVTTTLQEDLERLELA